MKYVLVLILPVLSLACTTAKPSKRTAPSTTRETGVEIVRIVSRENVIIARAGLQGTEYCLQTASGQVLVRSQTLDQLQAQHPRLAGQIKTMNAASDHPTAWAGVE
jgi:hypothetical protein